MAKIGQPVQIGVGQDAELNDDWDLPAHPGDEQIRPAAEPVLGPRSSGSAGALRGRVSRNRSLISASILRQRLA